MDPAQLIDLVISIAMIPLLFAVGYALTLVTLIVLNLFLHDDRDDHGARSGIPSATWPAWLSV